MESPYLVIISAETRTWTRKKMVECNAPSSQLPGTRSVLQGEFSASCIIIVSTTET